MKMKSTSRNYKDDVNLRKFLCFNMKNLLFVEVFMSLIFRSIVRRITPLFCLGVIRILSNIYDGAILQIVSKYNFAKKAPS